MNKIKEFIVWFANSRFGEKFLNIIEETAILLLYILAIWSVEWVLGKLLGANANFWGDKEHHTGGVKVSYIFDTIHALVFIRFAKEILREIFWDSSRQHAKLARGTTTANQIMPPSAKDSSSGRR